jgi:poly(A) polymerase Pap1
MEAEAGPSFCKRRKVGTSYKKLKETEIHEILGTEESYEDYSSDTDYSYERSGSESNNENESDSDTESDYDVDEQNYNSVENSRVNRYKKLNISWTTEDFIPTVHQFCDSDSGVCSNSFDDSSKPVEYFLSLLTPASQVLKCGDISVPYLQK